DLADFRFRSSEKPGNVRAMLDEDDDAHDGQCRRMLWQAEKKERDGRGDRRGERRQRRIAAEESNAKPDHGEDQRRLPRESREHAEIGGDALAAPEAEPDRKEMAEECGEAGGDAGL